MICEPLTETFIYPLCVELVLYAINKAYNTNKTTIESFKDWIKPHFPLKLLHNHKMTQEIKSTGENEHIISEMLKDKIEQALNKKRTFAEDLINSL